MIGNKQVMVAFGVVTLVVLAGAWSGLLGQDLQSLSVSELLLIAVCGAAFVVVLVGERPAPVNRLSETGPELEPEQPLPSTRQSDAERLRLAFETTRRDEQSCERRYSERQCSLEELIRARALRLQAEIELIRFERQPRSWAEACAEHQTQQR